MILNFDVPLLDVDQNPMEGNSLGKRLANVIMNSVVKTTPYKIFEWGRKLSKSGKLDLDKTDFNILKKFIEDSEIPTLLKGGLLEVVENAKES